jgi:hypothetical protein
MNQPSLLIEYDASVFHELYEFHIARSILKQLGSAITSLGDIVCGYGLQDCVAVNLLHKHFDISDAERIVREYVGRTAYMKPQLTSHLTQGKTAILPYLWQYADGRYGPHFYPLEFAEYSGNKTKQAEAEIARVCKSTEFLRDLAIRLWDLGLEDIFGIALLHSRNNIYLCNGEAMLETTDVINRILTLEPFPEEALAHLDTTETLWIFSTPDHTQLAET